MGLLNSKERKKLKKLLLELPNLDDVQMRGLLVDALPKTVQWHVVTDGSDIIFANSLVNQVDADWAQSADGSWPILGLIEAAIDLVSDGRVSDRRLAGDLQRLLDEIQARIEPPLVPPVNPITPVTPVPAQSDIKLTSSEQIQGNYNLPPQSVDEATRATARALLSQLPLDTIPPVTPLPTGSRMPLTTNPLFVGREQEFKSLAKAFSGANTASGSADSANIGRAAVVTGIGGMGKTQFATEFVHRYGRYFQGGGILALLR